MNLLTFYQSEIDTYSTKLAIVKKKLLITSMSRLIIFLICSYLIFLAWNNTLILLVTLLFGVILFLIIVKIHSYLNEIKRYYTARIQINKNEMNAINGDLSFTNNGNEFDVNQHYFAKDIDLFGQNSFYQHINRCQLKESQEILAIKLLSNECDQIEEKQNTILELSHEIDFRHHFLTISSLVKTDIDSKTFISKINNYKPFTTKIVYYFSLIFPFFSASIFLMYALEMIPESFLVYQLLLGLFITGIYIKKVNQLSALASQTSQVLSEYAKLLKEIEDKDFKSDTLIKVKKSIEKEGVKSSKILNIFSKNLAALDQRNNIVFIVLANGYLLWDLKQASKIEKWIIENKNQMNHWFEAIFEMEALISLANFHFNHPSFVFPIIKENESQVIIEAKELGHFMIHPEKRISNDFYIKKDNFIIVTGANMAGKSTFLRTISLSILSANIGLPICAKEFTYKPIKLITSMRTSDSLLDDESYFFSELKRLKFIIEEIKKDKYFVILDEILKGTNSKDKEEGSKQFVKKLIELKSTGIIATHDLGLCDLSNEYTEIQNKYFDAEIINNELYFDYFIKEGVCKNMNASFLLKKMEII